VCCCALVGRVSFREVESQPCLEPAGQARFPDNYLEVRLECG
jgi:hypothetical protein